MSTASTTCEPAILTAECGTIPSENSKQFFFFFPRSSSLLFFADTCFLMDLNGCHEVGSADYLPERLERSVRGRAKPCMGLSCFCTSSLCVCVAGVKVVGDCFRMLYEERRDEG